MAAQAIYEASWEVGRFRVTLTVPPIQAGAAICASCEWDPRMPGRPLTVSERAQYDAGMQKAIEAIAKPPP